jgi:preprotein translocase subunit Sec63
MSLGDKLILLSLLVAVLLIGLIDAKPKSKSYYEILDVEQTAEPKDIKRAYHKLALKVRGNLVRNFFRFFFLPPSNFSLWSAPSPPV